ncbi:Transcription factor, MADS-box [Cordyceps fumosorosea ARSEF 2679]|uniref:Transcription factor, MADS-box n=1 Tax=Cordyceps fumosorosea (strain ARSEF 2679) TaxID=1081104 RepID=A0A167EVJ9_CORFA|nr:Transcription factor, MADS-box [Cordyceps fumosorosea ARSEF 2679]OAA44447.1 Transcription factor, MADS-box [Cordyceps fumosorosea ARSEF 2679]
MGRKKLVIEKIKEPRRRKVTFVKRKRGILKKAHELAVLTGSVVTLLIHNDNVSEKHAFGESDAVQIEHPTNVNQSASRDDAELQDWQVDELPLRSDAHATPLEPGSSSFMEELVPWQPVTLCDEETILAASLPGSNALSVDTSHWLALQDFSASSEWMQQFSSEGQDVLGRLFDDTEWQQYCTRYLG